MPHRRWRWSWLWEWEWEQEEELEAGRGQRHGRRQHALITHAEEAQDILDTAFVGTRPTLRPISVLVSRKVKKKLEKKNSGKNRTEMEQVTRNVQQVRAKIHMST